jgi:hypothetical protein
MRMLLLFSALLSVMINPLNALIIEVCPDCQYNNLQPAAQIAKPGDTILIHEGIYPGGNYISNLSGTSDKFIFIMSADGEEAIFRGGSSGFQLSDPSFLHISGLIFEGQTGNGVNIDDGGTYETPAHHIIIENCHWRNMNASGNNDMLKLSGLDSFLIINCTFINGADGGSGIDMVGCHDGEISQNRFDEQGSNCIQAKGGTSDIIIQMNLFRNGGQRSINIGGSTGLQYFRPLDANYEAKNIRVYSNIFVGSVAPVAFVGAVDCEVVNNTLYLPDKWAIRILQENTEPGFLSCSNNSFINNIVYLNASSSNPAINIGPNTSPESFTFSNNFWFNSDNPNWGGPNRPVSESSAYVNIDPLINPDEDDGISISQSSPVKGKGQQRSLPGLDFRANHFSNPRSVGAIEIDIPSFINEENLLAVHKELSLEITPSPISDNHAKFIIYCSQSYSDMKLNLYSVAGEKLSELWKGNLAPGKNFMDLIIPPLNCGVYIFNLIDSNDNQLSAGKIIIE